MALPPRGLFITGTDTAVGKTTVAAAIARGLTIEGRRVAVVKPVATGVEIDAQGNPSWPDVEILAAAVGGAPREFVAPIVLDAALAPPVAAREAGTRLFAVDVRRATFDALAWWSTERRAELAIVEGVGGLLCPVAEDFDVADLAVDLDYPLLIVARRGLGTLNHTLLTIEAARVRGLRVAGVVLNNAQPTVEPLAEATNPAELVRRLPASVPLLAELPHSIVAGLSPAIFGVDWYSLCAKARFGRKTTYTLPNATRDGRRHGDG